MGSSEDALVEQHRRRKFSKTCCRCKSKCKGRGSGQSWRRRGQVQGRMAGIRHRKLGVDENQSSRSYNRKPAPRPRSNLFFPHIMFERSCSSPPRPRWLWPRTWNGSRRRPRSNTGRTKLDPPPQTVRRSHDCHLLCSSGEINGRSSYLMFSLSSHGELGSIYNSCLMFLAMI